VPGAYLGRKGILVAAEGEDGDLGFGFEVHDPVDGDARAGVLADFADAVDLLAAASGGYHLGDEQEVARIVCTDFPADGGACDVAGDDEHVGLADSCGGGDIVGSAGYIPRGRSRVLPGRSPVHASLQRSTGAACPARTRRS